MTEEKRDWQYFIEGLRSFDETVTFEFCERYGTALERLAGRHLVTGLRQRLDPEDVVQSVYRTFFRRASDGQFQLSDRSDLWRLLCVITLTKVRAQARRQLRQKRNINKEVRLDPSSGGKEGPGDPAGAGPSPDESAEFADQFDQVMASFTDEERRIVEFKLQERTNDEVAALVGCSERTVRRILKSMQERLEASLGDDRS